ncbi:MAG: type III-B CRISPR module RAMP protein Cmr6 [Planctomycetota bacterium]|nr:MAG: type III-B CRISPR module RAMP protein Cmr6 [Planctomycetota bacterium]
MAEKIKGRLEITKNKKGKIIRRIFFTGKKGKETSMPLNNHDIPLEHNGKECEFTRDSSGQPETIWIGEEKYEKKVYANQPKSQGYSGGKKGGGGKGYGNRKDSRDFGGGGNQGPPPDSLDLSKTKLPQDVRRLGSSLNPDNFYLKLQKCARWQDDKFSFFKAGRRDIEFQIRPNLKETKSLYANWKKRMEEDLESLKNQGFRLSHSVFQPQWRMVLGLGGASVYEVSMTLHHIYGVPYLPGSSIKGITRSWVIQEFYGGDEEQASKDKAFQWVFGSKEDQGGILFLDAFPESLSDDMIQVDVMNPHYSDYYSEPPDKARKPPADYYNPVPIYFLTVENTDFHFYLALPPLKRRNIETKSNWQGKDWDLLELASHWLFEALSIHGIGAKTALGYGVMDKKEN